MMSWVGKIIVGLSVAVTATPSVACAVVLPDGYEGSRRQVQNVRSAINGATLIIDGEVIRPFIEGRQNAMVRIHRVLKGAPVSTVEVGETDSCSIRLDRLGERARFILFGGPAVYQLNRDQSEGRIEDRFLKSDRRRQWPYFEGWATSSN